MAEPWRVATIRYGARSATSTSGEDGARPGAKATTASSWLSGSAVSPAGSSPASRQNAASSSSAASRRSMSAAMPSRSPTSTPGCASVKRASSPGTSTSPAGSSAPIQTRPRRTPRSSSTSARAPSTSARTRRARAAIASPASVGVTRRLVRSNSGVPSSCSSRRIWCDSADWARWSSSAARVKWRWRTTASTLRNCRSSTRAIVDHDRCGENYVLRRSIVRWILGAWTRTRSGRRRRSFACWSRRSSTTHGSSIA